MFQPLSQNDLDQLASLNSTRNRTVRNVKVYEVPYIINHQAVFPKGSLTAIFSRDDEFLKLAESDFSVFGEMVSEAISDNASRPLIETPQELVSQMSNESANASLYLGSKPLLPLIAIPDGVRAAVAYLPYIGGEIEKKFSLENFTVGESSSEIGCVVVLRAPMLTAAEIAAILQVPSSETEIRIGRPSADYAIATAAAAVAIAYTVVAACAICNVNDDLLNVDSLSSEQISNLSHEATVAELMSIRRNLLHHQLNGNLI